MLDSKQCPKFILTISKVGFAAKLVKGTLQEALSQAKVRLIQEHLRHQYYPEQSFSN